MRQKAHDLHIGWGLLSASWCVWTWQDTVDPDKFVKAR